MVLNGEIDTKTANTLTVVCNALLSSIRTDEQEKRIEELEILLRQNDKRDKMKKINKMIKIAKAIKGDLKYPKMCIGIFCAEYGNEPCKECSAYEDN